MQALNIVMRNAQPLEIALVASPVEITLEMGLKFVTGTLKLVRRQADMAEHRVVTGNALLLELVQLLYVAEMLSAAHRRKRQRIVPKIVPRLFL